MFIKLDEKYVITSDEMNVILAVDYGMKEDKDGKECRNTSAQGFYASVEDAINGYLRRRVNASQATSIRELIEEIRDLRKYVHELVKGV